MTNVQTHCNECNKSLSLLQVTIGKCKCTNYYCKLHIQAEKHKCPFNYKDYYSNYLTSNMPIVVKEKVISF
jgi:predicted nucleic acid binding AN1-type Zn finger protein